MPALPLRPLLDRAFLQSEFAAEFDLYQRTGRDAQVRALLANWAARRLTGEREIEGAFINRFFIELWGYRDDGGGADTFTLRQQFPVPGAGERGGVGAADLALGQFGGEAQPVPQVVCEFKGVNAGLDRPQPRKGSNRSPTEQALDYLRHARRGMFDNAPVLPRFAIVTDMAEFRLYWNDRAPYDSQRFSLGDGDLFTPATLLQDGEAAAFDRFLFQRLFQPDMLLSSFGRTRLERLLERQGTRQKKLEKGFYLEYKDYRQTLWDAIKLQRPAGASDLECLRLAQKLLDRFIFIMFSEDMGGRLAFPPNLLRDELTRQSLDRFFDPADSTIWFRLQRIFALMNDGGVIGDDRIHRFNGGLFLPDAALDALRLPNHLFCARGQGRSDADIAADKRTLLYLSATYSYVADGDATNGIGLYTLGHIFEQSLVELEAL